MSIKFSDIIIDIKNLCYKDILLDISFEILRGEYAAIIGPNGGGKSTLMKIILGLINPNISDIKLFNTKQSLFKQYYKIGYVPQRATLIDSSFPITVQEVINLGLAYKTSLFSKISKEDHKKIESIMEKIEITDLKNRRISELSGGQRQRVMIARALISNPELLILDEPNTGVDTNSQAKFYEILKKLNKEDNITILFVTHDLGVIVNDIKRVLCINQTLLSCHTPHEILNNKQMSKLYGIDTNIVCHHH
ncbi:metal ABC transporter ATP-binding protein [Arcobacter sp.]|uniref:metal ABC transporter ATP-binding protein n=1 Tax=unclassified Arcobacter TaxID=2593671 RepID=UPI003B008E82